MASYKDISEQIACAKERVIFFASKAQKMVEDNKRGGDVAIKQFIFSYHFLLPDLENRKLTLEKCLKIPPLDENLIDEQIKIFKNAIIAARKGEEVLPNLRVSEATPAPQGDAQEIGKREAAELGKEEKKSD